MQTPPNLWWGVWGEGTGKWFMEGGSSPGLSNFGVAGDHKQPPGNASSVWAVVVADLGTSHATSWIDLL